MTDFASMTSAQLNDWYEQHVGYRPQEDHPPMTDAELRDLCDGVHRRHFGDPHAICAKWVARIGQGFHPDTRGEEYSPALSAEEIAEYDTDIEVLFDIAADPYACAVMAMADRGLA